MKTIYFNGRILTLEEPLYAPALLVEDGIISALGDKEKIFDSADKSTVFIDLKDHTLMPAMIDAHGHLTANSSAPSLGERETCISAAEREAFKYGIVTLCDAKSSRSDWKLLRGMAERSLLKADVLCYPDALDPPELIDELAGRYVNRLKIGGLHLDLSKAEDNSAAEATVSAMERNRQIVCECETAETAERFVRLFREAKSRAKISDGGNRGLRPVLAHAQVLSRELLGQIKQLGIVPSFYLTALAEDPEALRHAGDSAEFACPARSAERAEIPFTFHRDYPHHSPNLLRTVQNASLRAPDAKRDPGEQFGESERITALSALRAVTVNAARQIFEDSKKGTLKAGKYADFAILSANPLTVPPQTIGDISVVATVRRGETVFQRRPF